MQTRPGTHCWQGFEALEPRLLLAGDVPLDLPGADQQQAVVVLASVGHDLAVSLDPGRARLHDSVVSGDGSRFRLSVTLSNQGDAPLPDQPIDLVVHAVLVGDPTFRYQVHVEQGVNLRNLQPGRQRQVNLNFTLPPGMETGRYVFEVTADPDNQLGYTDTAGRGARLPDAMAVDVARGFVDLAVELDAALRLDPAVVAGQGGNGRIRVNVSNLGNVSLPRGQQIAVLALLWPVQGDDQAEPLVVGSTQTNASNLRPDRIRRVVVNVVVGADVPEDQYQLVVMVQPQGQLQEPDTLNNVQVTDVSLVVAEPFVDLIVGIDQNRVRLPDQVVSGDGTRLRLPLTIQNAGNVRLNSHDVDIRVVALPVAHGQLDSSGDPVEVAYVEDMTLRNLQPGRERRQNLNFVLPPGMASGQYTFHVELLTHSDTIAGDTATLHPSHAIDVARGYVDLSLEFLRELGVVELEQGSTDRLRLSTQVFNLGNVNLPRDQDVRVTLYLRPDGVNNASQDRELGSQIQRVSNLRPSAFRRVNLNLALSGQEPAGEYRLVAVVQPVQPLVEAGISNNLRVSNDSRLLLVPQGGWPDEPTDPDDPLEAQRREALLSLLGAMSFEQVSRQAWGSIQVDTAGNVDSDTEQLGPGYQTSVYYFEGLERYNRRMDLTVQTTQGDIELELLFERRSSRPESLDGRILHLSAEPLTDGLNTFTVRKGPQDWVGLTGHFQLV